MTVTSGETQREAAALADTLTNQSQPAAPSQSEQQVPVHVIQAMREELRAEKEKNEAFRNHLQMMQWQQQAAQPQQPAANPFANADPEDSIKVKDAVKFMSDFEQRTRAEIAEVKLASRTPDYKDVIQKYLPKAAQEDPEILDEIRRSPNPYKAAYLAAKASKAYYEDISSTSRVSQSYAPPPPPKVDPEAERMIHNSKQSGNLASVGNLSSNSGKYPSFSQMSDDEFRKFKAQKLFGQKHK